MRLLLASFQHETNTFSPVPTPYERFSRAEGASQPSEDVVQARRGSGSGIGGFIDVAEAYRAEIVVPVVAEAWPSGPVDSEAYERIANLIVAAAAKERFDGILLDLHGAMVTTEFDDGEGELLRRIREVQPNVPIGVTLDMHANVCPEMIAQINVLTGYHTYPHIDMFSAGKRAAELICRSIRGEVRPVLAWDNRPMLPHVMRQGTHTEPNLSLQARCVALEEAGGGILAASVFTGFPHADIYHAGLSAVVCTDADADLARQTCQSLLDEAWRQRRAFVYQGTSLREAVSRAKDMEQGPIVLLDHCDNVSSGGTMDTTALLKEVLRQNLTDAVFYGICDPQAVQQAIAAGVGNELDLQLGGRAELSSTGEANEPIQLRARVRTISDGHFRVRGPMSKGIEMSTGKSVVLETGAIQIVVVSSHMEPFDLNCFYTLGIDPTQKRYLVLKSRVHWRSGFGDLATHVIECDGVGITTSDYNKLPFHKIRRPIYPLDPI